MSANVPNTGTAYHNQGSLLVPVREGPPSEDEELGVIWRCKPATAHQRKLTAARDAADVIRLRRAKGRHESACAYAAPIEEAMAGLPCPDAEKREEVCDAMEDVAQGNWRASKTKENLKALLRARAAMRQSSLDADREEVAKAPKEWEVSL